MKRIISALLAFTAFGFLSPAFALQGESIVFDPATGNYLITYLSSRDNKLHQITFIPATKINPTFQSKLKLEPDRIVHYGYALTNGRDSQQVIRGFILDPVSSVTSSLPDIPLNAPPGKIMGDMSDVANYFDTPPGPWRALMGYSRGQMSFRISLGYRQETGGLVPGDKVVFGFKSRDLPGIILAAVRGYAPDSQKISGEETQDAEDGGFGQQYTELVFKKNFVPRYAAVPTIVVSTPFDAAVLLDRIQTQMHTWIGMQLLDATFSSQLDRYLAAAADAYRHNQPKVAKEDIEKVREMLKKEHKDLSRDEEHESEKSQEKNDDRKSAMIDRLSARVLDFDLKYVIKHAGGDKDD